MLLIQIQSTRVCTRATSIKALITQGDEMLNETQPTLWSQMTDLLISEWLFMLFRLEHQWKTSGGCWGWQSPQSFACVAWKFSKGLWKYNMATFKMLISVPLALLLWTYMWRRVFSDKHYGVCANMTDPPTCFPIINLSLMQKRHFFKSLFCISDCTRNDLEYL